MKTRSLLTSLALLGALLACTPAAFAKDKKKSKEKEPTNNLDANGVNRNQDAGRQAPVYEAQRVTLKVENNTGQVVGIYYVSPQGTTENLGELPADGKKREVPSYAGQTWIFKIGRQVIQQYRATGDSKQSISLGGGGGGGGYRGDGGGGYGGGGGGGGYAPPPAPYVVDPPVRRGGGGGNFAPEVGDRAGFLRVHNDARAQVRVAPLRWDPGCADAAQGWANTLAQRDRGLSHSGRQDYGENVWGGSGRDFGPADAARAWLSERDSYNGGPIDESNRNVGHYTQMVWSRTTAVGYGIARSARGTIYIVANYAPPGNMLGQRPYGR